MRKQKSAIREDLNFCTHRKNRVAKWAKRQRRNHLRGKGRRNGYNGVKS